MKRAHTTNRRGWIITAGDGTWEGMGTISPIDIKPVCACCGRFEPLQ